MQNVRMPRQPEVFLSTVFDEVLRAPIFARCSGRIWLEKPIPEIERKGRTIEDVCRDMIRLSAVFIGLFDARGGRALAFTRVKTPVSVLEIELVQALFQRMPNYLFLLPGFETNERLNGLVKLIEKWRLAFVRHSETGSGGGPGTALPVAVNQIVRLIRHPSLVSLRRGWSRIAQRFRRTHNLDIQFLNLEFDLFPDPFDERDTLQLIEAGAAQNDHASRLAMLWAAVRQLCSVPYTKEEFRHWRFLWERTLSEWIRSAAWYGLHDDSPIGLLSAVNSVIWIRAQPFGGAIPESSPVHIHGTKGARASALYSMAKRSWWLPHRWSLLNAALMDVDAAITTRPTRLSGYLAIRGSIYRTRGQLFRAVKDHETMVAVRRRESGSATGMGEALSELGWTYAWAGNFLRAKRSLIEGVRLLSETPVSSPMQAGFRVRALRKCAAVQALTFDFAGAQRTRSEAQRIANAYLVPDQMRSDSKSEWQISQP
jgi:hypothetical protein